MAKPVKSHTVAIKLSDRSYELLKDYRFDNRIDKLSEAAASIVLDALGTSMAEDDEAAVAEASVAPTKA